LTLRLADETVVGVPDEGGGGAGILLAECVEHGSQQRVDSRQFQYITLLAESEVDVIIEVEGAGSSWRDAAQLQAGFGKHQRLGLHGNLQFVQHRFQVAEFGVPGEL